MEVESEDEPVSRMFYHPPLTVELKRKRVIDDNSDSDAPIRKPAKAVKKTTTADNALKSFSYQSSPASSVTSTPVKPRTSSAKSSAKKGQTPDSSIVEEEGNALDKKVVAILNAGEHTHDHTEWMVHPRDRYGHAVSDPDYDPTSLQVPPGYLKGCTNGMKQWWGYKQVLYDCIVLLKVGKFYESYHMDADILVKELDLVYMKGEMAHAGFPEAAYSKFSNMLVNKGYRVARVEQTETPQMLKERNARSSVKVAVWSVLSL